MDIFSFSTLFRISKSDSTPRFTAMPGYEISASRNGRMTLYFLRPPIIEAAPLSMFRSIVRRARAVDNADVMY